MTDSGRSEVKSKLSKISQDLEDQVGSSHSKETVRSLHKRELLEKEDIGVFSITNQGERVLQEKESKPEDQTLGDFS